MPRFGTHWVWLNASIQKIVDDELLVARDLDKSTRPQQVIDRQYDAVVLDDRSGTRVTCRVTLRDADDSAQAEHSSELSTELLHKLAKRLRQEATFVVEEVHDEGQLIAVEVFDYRHPRFAD